MIAAAKSSAMKGRSLVETLGASQRGCFLAAVAQFTAAMVEMVSECNDMNHHVEWSG
jgi:hypothetical protein